jgi:hypothetical protein
MTRLNWTKPCVVTAIMLLFSIGCGGEVSDAPDLVDAYGTVTVDGAPLPNARVAFVTTQGSPAGVTDASGTYKIEYNDSLNGAFPGKTTVVVKKLGAADIPTTTDPDEEEDDEDDDADFEEKEEAEANALTEWNIEMDVKADGAPFNFDLKQADAI